MQRIERYGVIALVFLLVTVAAVAFWGERATETPGDGSSAKVSKALEGSPQKPAAQPAAQQKPRQNPPAALDSKVDPHAPARPAGGERIAGDLIPLEARTPARPAPKSEAAPAPQPSSATPAAASATPELDPVELELLGVKPGPSGGARPASGAPTTVEYVVKKGETLSSIALATLGSTRRWEEIAALNGNLEPSRLRVGQTIRLPKGAVFAVGAEQPKAPAAQAPAARAAEKAPARGSASKAPTHVVAEGEVLSAIAQRYLGRSSRWREIAELNPRVDPKRLFVGTVLVLPADATDSAPAASSTGSVAKATPAAGDARKENRVR